MEQNLSQAALAERLGISASYLNLLEHDRRSLTTALLLKLAQVLGLELRDLAAGADAAADPGAFLDRAFGRLELGEDVGHDANAFFFAGAAAVSSTATR